MGCTGAHLVRVSVRVRGRLRVRGRVRVRVQGRVRVRVWGLRLGLGRMGGARAHQLKEIWGDIGEI